MSLTRSSQTSQKISSVPNPLRLDGRAGKVDVGPNPVSRWSRVRGAGSEPDYTPGSLGSKSDE
jgi:hypothetical protein